MFSRQNVNIPWVKLDPTQSKGHLSCLCMHTHRLQRPRWERSCLEYRTAEWAKITCLCFRTWNSRAPVTITMMSYNQGQGFPSAFAKANLRLQIEHYRVGVGIESQYVKKFVKYNWLNQHISMYNRAFRMGSQWLKYDNTPPIIFHF